MRRELECGVFSVLHQGLSTGQPYKHLKVQPAVTRLISVI